MRGAGDEPREAQCSESSKRLSPNEFSLAALTLLLVEELPAKRIPYLIARLGYRVHMYMGTHAKSSRSPFADMCASFQG
jgi:hypothetical protein